MKKKRLLVVGIFLVILIGIGIFFFSSGKFNSPSTITTKDIDSSVNTDDGDSKIEWSNYENREIILSKSIKITDEGVYNLSGTIDDGLITVDTTGNVKLNLSGVSITNSSGPAIYIKNASDVVITISGDNYLEDGDSYSGYEDVDGTLFSYDDLTLDGEGSLTIKSNYKDGIVSKDDLKIINGNYIIDSSDDGIRGKDSVYILNGSFSIKCLGDGVKTTNDTDSEKGFIKIENGKFKIDSSLDGMQAESKLVILDGEFDIITGDGSSNSSSLNDNWGRWGSSYSADTSSAKGLKSVDNLVISGGTFTFDTSDDSIHSNNYVGVSDGVINISSGDDAIHADLELVIDGGVIKATKSYEGLEASKITINGGDISVTSSDDGINVAGGNDSSSMNRPGENTYADSDNTLIINGGSVIVNASGDGIDVNGNGYINGGTTMVYGPSNGGNGALDYDRSFEINGGLFMAGGSSGMAQGATNGSKQNNVMINFTQTYSSGDVIVIVDSNNNEVMSYSSDKSYSSLVLSSSKLESNKTYTIKVNGNKYDEFTVNSVCNSVGSSYGGMNGGASHSGGRR